MKDHGLVVAAAAAHTGQGIGSSMSHNQQNPPPPQQQQQQQQQQLGRQCAGGSSDRKGVGELLVMPFEFKTGKDYFSHRAQV
jgi:hypothetical protein